jgi:hypothetical protein
MDPNIDFGWDCYSLSPLVACLRDQYPINFEKRFYPSVKLLIVDTYVEAFNCR